MNRHRFELTIGSHRNATVQADWKRFGTEAFSFEVLERVNKNQDPDVDLDAELAALLAMWLDELPCHGEHGYNGPLRPVARSHPQIAWNAALAQTRESDNEM